MWSKNGQLQLLCYYKEGKYHGEYKVWWKKGQLELLCYYKEGKLEGEYKVWWNEDGILREHKVYREGEVIEDLLSLE